MPSYIPGLAALLAEAIVARDATVCQRLFSPQGAGQLAAGAGAADCPAALQVWADQVSDPVSYANPDGVKSQTVAPGRVAVDACSLTWLGSSVPAGPQLGRLDLEWQQGSTGYLVVGWRSC